MVICAVATCNARTGREKGVSFFSFPKNPQLRRIWTLKCQRKDYVPSKHAKICERHFEESSFILSKAFAASIGFKMNFELQLKPDAVPTIIPKPQYMLPSSVKRKPTKLSVAWVKRQRLKTVKELMTRSEDTCDFNKHENPSKNLLEAVCDSSSKDIEKTVKASNNCTHHELRKATVFHPSKSLDQAFDFEMSRPLSTNEIALFSHSECSEGSTDHVKKSAPVISVNKDKVAEAIEMYKSLQMLAHDYLLRETEKAIVTAEAVVVTKEVEKIARDVRRQEYSLMRRKPYRNLSSPAVAKGPAPVAIVKSSVNSSDVTAVEIVPAPVVDVRPSVTSSDVIPNERDAASISTVMSSVACSDATAVKECATSVAAVTSSVTLSDVTAVEENAASVVAVTSSVISGDVTAVEKDAASVVAMTSSVNSSDVSAVDECDQKMSNLTQKGEYEIVVCAVPSQSATKPPPMCAHGLPTCIKCDRCLRLKRQQKRNENPTKRYWCDECPRWFLRQWTFAMHKRKHAENKAVRYNLGTLLHRLPKKSTENGELTMRRSAESFASVQNKSHSASSQHAPQLLFTCTRCHERFAKPAYLLLHMAAVHENAYRCSYCAKRFCHSYSLTLHQVLVHGSTNQTSSIPHEEANPREKPPNLYSTDSVLPRIVNVFAEQTSDLTARPESRDIKE